MTSTPTAPKSICVLQTCCICTCDFNFPRIPDQNCPPCQAWRLPRRCGQTTSTQAPPSCQTWTLFASSDDTLPVFLDIRIPVMSGRELFASLDVPRPQSSGHPIVTTRANPYVYQSITPHDSMKNRYELSLQLRNPFGKPMSTKARSGEILGVRRRLGTARTPEARLENW